MLTIAGLASGGSGCGRWKPLAPEVVRPVAATDPATNYRTVRDIVAEQKYRIVQQDDAKRIMQVLAHVDESDTGHQSYIVIQVDDSAAVQLSPAGALVVENKVHRALNNEVKSLKEAIASRIGGGSIIGWQTSSPASSNTSTTAVANTGIAAGPGGVTNAPPQRFTRGDTQRNAYALVVGIEKYRDVPAAAGARADAEDFARVVELTLGVPPPQIHKIFDERATKTDVENELEWIKLNVPKGGRVFFYYSGHGAPGAKSSGNSRVETPYLVPYDGKSTSLAKTGLPLSQILETLKRSSAKEVFAFLDSCFSGNEGFRSPPSAGTHPVVPVELTPPVNAVVYAASKSDQTAGPDSTGQRGLFTKYLIEALGSAKAEYNGDRNITFKELKDWVNNRVQNAAKQASRIQEPDVNIGRGSESAIDESIVAFGVSSD